MKRKLFIDMDGTLVDFMSGVTKVDKTIVQQFEGHYPYHSAVEKSICLGRQNFLGNKVF